MDDFEDDDHLPPGWEERATYDGQIYFVNHVTETTHWIHPQSGKRKFINADLPIGWTKTVDDCGKIIYSNEATNTQTYTDPRLAFSTADEINIIRCPYDASSTALEVLHGVNLSGKTAIVTGSNSGIGYEAASALALHGCKIIFACRSKDLAQDTISKIRRNENCVPLQLDLSSLKSVEDFCSSVKEITSKLDIIILNAAIFDVPYSLTEDGIESTFQVCHLSHFYLVKLLENEILSAYSPRIVIVSCESHRFSNLTIDGLNETLYQPKENQYWSTMCYNNAKLCNLLFANELHRRWYSKGVNTYVVHPGNMVYTQLYRFQYRIVRLIYRFCSFFTKSLEQAASTVVYCATSSLLNSVSGVYMNNCHICAPSHKSQDIELSEQLWLLSENLISKFVKLKTTIVENKT